VLLVSPLGLPLRERMATEKLEMHVLREILRQKLGLGRSHRQVATSVGVSAGIVAGVFAAARPWAGARHSRICEELRQLVLLEDSRASPDARAKRSR
jgi:hypothetical protein